MYISLIILNSFIISKLSRNIGLKGCIILTIINYVIAIIWVVFLLLNFNDGINFYQNSFQILKYIDFLSASFPMSLQSDNIGLLMSLIILIISLIIHLYSFNYLSKDEQVIRFIFYLSLFSIFMLILSTASNLITIFIGWEGVGILSYLLINF